MMESPAWNSKNDESIFKAAGALHLRKYGQFFEDLAEKTWRHDSVLENYIEGPIRLVYRAVEDISILSLVTMENETLSKLLAAVAGTCREIRLLKLEASSFYTKLFCHSETNADGDKINFTSLLANLQDLSVFVKRIFTVIHLTAQQMASLATGANEIYLPTLIEHFVDLFMILITLDEIIDSYPSIMEQWKKYRMHVRSIIHNPSQFDIPEAKLHMFDKLINDLQKQLLQKNMFSKAVDHIMEIKKGSSMNDQLLAYVRNVVTDIESKCSDNAVLNKNYIRINIAIVIVTKLFGSCDKKLLRRIQEVNKKLYAITLTGNVMWLPSKFLHDFLPKDTGQVIGSQVGEKLLLTRTQRLPQIVNNFVHRALIWYTDLQSILMRTEFEVSDIGKKTTLLMQIFTLLAEINEIIFFITNLHATLSKPMNRNTVQMICRLIEVQRSLQTSFYDLSPIIVQSQGQVLQYLSYQILAALEKARKGLIQKDRGYSRERLDALSLIGLSMQLISGPGTADRRLIARCALACASQLTDSFKEEEIVKLRFFLDNYDTITELFDRVEEVCDYSILLHHQNMIPAYFSSVIENNLDINHVRHFFNAYNTAILKLEGSDLRNCRVSEMKEMLIKNILEPTCREIETTLRLHVHSHLKLDSTNPFQIGAKSSGRIVQCFPLPLGEVLIYTKRYIEHYLDDMFYNLTTVALHDWKTYKTMHALAHYKLGLDTVQNHLPTQTLEQGLDALEIMRNIHVFVSKYLYNLNMQTFIEHTSSNKHLNTIGIRHIANSIRTHGTGIMSTTVNFIYQFLRVKLHTFSQFLFDEHIKSRLMRDIRFIKSQREHGATPYTYERAEKFQKGIRKLGMTSDGLSYLDQFRQLITQIGNALGYVRLIRSGGMYASSNAVSFLPDINSSVSFESMCNDLRYSETTQSAAKRLEDDIVNLVHNFTEGIQYFKLLVDVFASAFRDAKSHHLHQFYAIVPPLTLSFVDNSMSNKEKIFKKNQIGAAFTDDGFAMGVAYVNALLDQSAELDGLHWFKTVEQHINAEKLCAENKDDHGDEKLQQTRALTIKRLAERSQEFKLLYYSFSGARVFFKQPES